MIVDIYNEVLTKLKTDLTGVNVTSTVNPEKPDYPQVTFAEKNNNEHKSTIDSGGVNHNEISFEVVIYTIGNTRMSDAKAIRGLVDGVMSGHYKMARDFSDEIPNLGNAPVYRYIMRYSTLVNTNKVIFRR